MIRVFTGTEVTVIILKGKLEAIGISVLIRNNFQSEIAAGFVGGVPSAVDVYIQEIDLKDAEPIINEFIQNNN